MRNRVVQVAANGFFEGQCIPGRLRSAGGTARVDVQYFSDRERERLRDMQQLLPQYRTRPALVQVSYAPVHRDHWGDFGYTVQRYC